MRHGEAIVALGDAIRREGLSEGSPLEPLGAAVPLPVDRLHAALPAGCVDALVAGGLLVVRPPAAAFTVGFLRAGDIVAAMPLDTGSDEPVYIGPDSAYLIEAALRLAPSGERAAELGTGSGFLAAILASRYRTVIATDVLPHVAATAQLTLALNRVPLEHAAGACVADVAAGLRPCSFDLVAANAPWVPAAPEAEVDRFVFAHGGPTGAELPGRFIAEGASLLRAGGVAITLALDVTLGGDRRPLRATVDALDRAGMTTAIIPTPVNARFPAMPANLRNRQPDLVEAEHVAVVVARPHERGGSRASLLAAAAALGERWRSGEPRRSP